MHILVDVEPDIRTLGSGLMGIASRIIAENFVATHLDVDWRQPLGDAIERRGIRIAGVMSIEVRVRESIDDVLCEDRIAGGGIAERWAAICQIGPG